MRQHLANQAVLVILHIMHSYTRHRKMLRSLGANGFTEFPPPPADLSYGPRMRTLPPCSRGRDYEQSMALDQERVLARIDETFVS